MPPTPAAAHLPRPNPGPPHQIHRLREFLAREYPGTDVPGEHAADQAIRLFREHRDTVDLARALVAAQGFSVPTSDSGDQSDHTEGLTPFERRPEVVGAIRVTDGLLNVGQILALIPADRYRLSITRTEITMTDVMSDEIQLGWASDWFVRTATGAWLIVEQDDFAAKYQPLPANATERTSRA